MAYKKGGNLPTISPHRKEPPATLNRQMCRHKRWSRSLGEHKNRLFQPRVGTQVFNLKQNIILQASEQRGKRGIFESKNKQQDADKNYKGH